MALQNIGARNRDDAFYRYKMPRMITKIEGRGNGIKTNIVNMVDIAKALARPAAYTTKYFGYELGTISSFDEKTGTSLVNGAHDTPKLAALLENFIKKCVQCYGCGNPETEILITKTRILQLKCAACGFMSDVDVGEKLTNLILKNPPESKEGLKDKKAMRRAEKERLKEGAAADEELKKLKKEAFKLKKSSKVSADENVSAVVEDDDDGVQWLTDTSMQAAQKRIQEQLSAVTSEMVMLSTNEDNPSGKKSPPREPKPKLSDSNSLVRDLKDFLSKGSTTAGQLKTHLGSINGSAQEAVDALFDALFDKLEKGFAKEATKRKNYVVAALAYADSDQSVLLRAIETFCGKACPDVVKEVGLVLKSLYDADVLEEEAIVEWFEKGSAASNKRSSVWKHVKPFVEWLQSAESESESESEE